MTSEEESVKVFRLPALIGGPPRSQNSTVGFINPSLLHIRPQSMKTVELMPLACYPPSPHPGSTVPTHPPHAITDIPHMPLKNHRSLEARSSRSGPVDFFNRFPLDIDISASDPDKSQAADNEAATVSWIREEGVASIPDAPLDNLAGLPVASLYKFSSAVTITPSRTRQKRNTCGRGGLLKCAACRKVKRKVSAPSTNSVNPSVFLIQTTRLVLVRGAEKENGNVQENMCQRRRN